jgi:hypothetical protein
VREDVTVGVIGFVEEMVYKGSRRLNKLASVSYASRLSSS